MVAVVVLLQRFSLVCSSRQPLCVKAYSHGHVGFRGRKAGFAINQGGVGIYYSYMRFYFSIWHVLFSLSNLPSARVCLSPESDDAVFDFRGARRGLQKVTNTSTNVCVLCFNSRLYSTRLVEGLHAGVAKGCEHRIERV